ncbi:MAG: adenosylcobinamide-GDP ribazoletransferase [Candidatus Dormibacteraeota bacterium]|nr:adenosylcobinamide-GDP ribazoletransferase [Candidatus Dormibacteraeota bacterium]MBO0760560.1 adenosylcobinamide-GDP ribazoletransferase [Candidatus Dormibacteraeota bacterium]
MRSALSFLTILPVPRGGTPDGRLGRVWFPAVGAVLGLLAGAVFWSLERVLGAPVAAVGAVAALAVLTGGLHLDGLADAADGLLGGRSPERRLEIMRDSRVGVFGAVSVVLLLLAEVAALARLDGVRAVVALVVAGALSRWALLLLVGFLPYVRETGLGVAAAGGRRVLDVALGSVPAALVVLLDWRRGLLAAGLALAAAALVALVAWRRVGGATGDVYGAGTELAQLAAILAFAAEWR